jgi:hypothetical protein
MHKNGGVSLCNITYCILWKILYNYKCKDNNTLQKKSKIKKKKERKHYENIKNFTNI